MSLQNNLYLSIELTLDASTENLQRNFPVRLYPPPPATVSGIVGKANSPTCLLLREQCHQPLGFLLGAAGRL
jgi:hypothetical protein